MNLVELVCQIPLLMSIQSNAMKPKAFLKFIAASMELKCGSKSFNATL